MNNEARWDELVSDKDYTTAVDRDKLTLLQEIRDLLRENRDLLQSLSDQLTRKDAP